ncbi:hypothetical protein ACVGVM_13940 [Pseudonocardia bannensis]|uniref:Uncharacterized protein n=1 Tax=Pseudonocardia bannensis TaxID=630973 RepID=A0A848DKU5_9PSEU|nr:hypothetical protein [Pseudonocardia bannensis]NMH93347.1 hypothetical protein [Pseudonocardia bannensis]
MKRTRLVSAAALLAALLAAGVVAVEPPAVGARGGTGLDPAVNRGWSSSATYTALGAPTP